MTRYNAQHAFGPLPLHQTDEDRVYGLLAAVCGPSGRCDADLVQIARLLRIRPVSLRIALLALRVRRRVRVDRKRGEMVSVVLNGREVIR